MNYRLQGVFTSGGATLASLALTALCVVGMWLILTNLSVGILLGIAEIALPVIIALGLFSGTIALSFLQNFVGELVRYFNPQKNCLDDSRKETPEVPAPAVSKAVVTAAATPVPAAVVVADAADAAAAPAPR